MKENWYALFLCMCKEISIDKSLSKMAIVFKSHHQQSNPRASKYSDKDIKKIISLKNKGKSYREIGEILGMTPYQAAGAIRMHKEKSHRVPTKVTQMA